MEKFHIPHLGYRTKLDLRERFPASPRYALRKAIWWVFACIVAVAFYRITERNPEMVESLPHAITDFGRVVIGAAVTVLVLKLIYAEIYRRTFYYGLDGFRIIISRGIFLPQVGSLPLLPVSEVYISRDFGDLLCHVCHIDLYTPMDNTRRFARVEGLAPSTAMKLQEFLSELLNVQIFLAPEAKGEFDYLKNPSPQPDQRMAVN